ncbi:Amino acid adenylation [Cordyceps fumosorosea ARSEF 2679]|uniref:Amino acid adenylation n=1 Tax=Cordyceps fumosorosea (strain ARSEF 2679) TaxID=1081104 RepID=A0A168D6S8_CORFA|nr:Amino acid adenylation [Cordyceps fumosorosea ARSEF 2679]OAA72235.1 Amino acid adenylation [Cordyceps fumosorosea ARSEF 2679]
MNSPQPSHDIPVPDLERIWGWNATVPESVDRCVHDLIAEVTSRQPSAEAICAWDGTMTYQQLDSHSTRLAHHLVRLGVQPGAIVLLCFEKSLWTPVAMLAVMKAGAASVAVDLVQPEDRLRAIVQQVAPVLVISSVKQEPVAAKLLTSMPASASVVVIDDGRLDQLPPLQGDDVLPTVDPSSLLYVVFTSGSTGRPKGVSIRHANLASAVRHQQSAHGFRPDSRVYDFASYAFDVAWMNVLHTFTAGAVLCIPSEEDRRDDFSGSILRLRVTYAEMTPTMAHVLAPETARTLRTIVLGGEKASAEALERFPAGVEMKNTYGPSECTPTSTITDIDRGVPFSGSIGTGYGVNTWIVAPEDHERLVPIGTVGELVIEGPLVGAGYIGDPEKTAAVFIKDPPWLVRGAPGHAGRAGRVYRTGDLVRYNQDGEIIFVGRQDSQIKVNGQRTELGEIEHIVKECLALTTDGDSRAVVEHIIPSGSKRPVLVAFLDVDEGGSEYFTQLKARGVVLEQHLTRRLPAYMTIFALLPVAGGFPLTVSGKLDRRALRARAEALGLEELSAMNPCRTAKRPPATPTERAIQALWARILDISPSSIGVDDSFLRVGGDSITVMKFVALARDQGLRLTVAEILKKPRLGDLAAGAAAEETTAEVARPFELLRPGLSAADVRFYAAGLCGVQTERVEDVFPCTPLQEGLLALTARRAGEYVATEVLPLREGVDAGRFRAAWAAFVAQTPILRTRMIDVPGQGIVQVVIAQDGSDDALASGDDTQSLGDYVRQHEQTRMELGTPLLHARLVRQPRGNTLIWTIHHALFDGWSVPLMLTRLEAIYDNVDAPPPPAPPFQDFVRHIVKADPARTKAFWEAQVRGLEARPFPALPAADYEPRPTAVLSRRITDVQWPRAGVTPTMALRAAWAVVISQYTSNKDVLYGVTVAGRHAPVNGVEAMVGPTIATVPLRVQLDYGKTVGQLLTDMQQQAVDMIDYEQAGLLSISRVNAEARTACQFQTLLVVQPSKADTTIEYSVFADDEEEEGESGPDSGFLGAFDSYAINIICHLEPSGVWLQVNHDSAVFSSDATARMVAQMEHVLRQLCVPRNLDGPLAEAVTISEADAAGIQRWNAQLPEAEDRCVHELIQETASRQPDAGAIDAWDGKLTYAQLDAHATKLAGFLAGRGVGMGSFVPLCFEKSVWTPVAMLAVMKTGAASVAMDPEQPEQRLQTIVQQIQPRLLLSSTKHQALANKLAASSSIQVVAIDEAWMTATPLTSPPPLPPLPPLPPPPSPAVTPHTPLFVLFTSGTTGTPKGVLVTHANMSAALRHQRDFFHYNTPQARVYDFSSYAFDAAWLNLLFALTGGPCLLVPSQDERRDDLAGSMARRAATHVDMTPTAAALLPDEALRRLRGLTLGGERLPENEARRWASLVGGHVNNMYGPSECAATATILRVTPDMVPDSIGAGVGVCTWIVDPEDADALVPVGCAGELLLEGPLVGPGYLGQPDKTAAAFIEDPPWLQRLVGRRGRLYKTGDLVRYHAADGSLVFVGRKDTQVKFNGQRLELEGLEHVIQKCLGQGRAVVEVVTPKQAGKSVLVAFVDIGAADEDVFFRSMHARQAEMEDRLAQSLPTNIIISAFIPRRGGFPLTTAGKIDRRVLRAEAEGLTLEQLAALNPYRAKAEKRPPTTEAERIVQALWASTLGISPEAIGADDSFLRIGGDSVSAMRVVGLARQQGVHLTVAEMLKRPRLSDLAKVVGTLVEPGQQAIAPLSLVPADASKTRLDAARLCGVRPEQIQDVFPCTPLQEGLLALTARRGGDYVAQEVFEIRPEIDIPRLQDAWQRWVAGTPILRTRIVDLPGQGLMQVVVDEAYAWPEMAVASEEQDVEHYTRMDIQHPMGLGVPLMRFRLVRSDDRHHLVWTIHHALYDGWSMSLMLSSLESTYNNNNNLIPAPPPYQAFVQHVNSISQDDVAGFWQEQLHGLEAQTFPALPSPTYRPDAGRSLVRAVSDLSWPRADATPTVVLRASLAVVLAQYTGLRDVVLGTTVAGRHVPVPGVERILGPTIATVPLRVPLDFSRSAAHLLANLQAQMARMIDYEQAGLPRIARVGGPEAAAACQFQTLLVVQPDEETQTAPGLFVAEAGEQEEASTEQGLVGAFDTYAINIVCQLKPGGVRLQVNYDEAVVSEEQMKGIAAQVEFMLRQFCSADLDGKLADLVSLNETDLASVWAWNSTVPETATRGVQELITDSVARHPEDVAVCAWDGQLTYRELDARSTRMAHHLVRLGVRGFVPLCFEKSVWTPVAMLAVMKAGAASVAMDPAQPEERLKTIVQQVKATLILSSASQRELVDRLVASSAASAVVVDEAALAHLLEPEPEPEPSATLPAAKPEDPLYVVFTSGSTGNPKGVIVTHANISSAIQHQNQALGFTRASRVYDFASYTFDLVWCNLLQGLAAGGTLCIPSDQTRRANPLQGIDQLSANASLLTPSTVRALDAAGLAGLDTLHLIGESFRPDDVARVPASTAIHNMYGPSECTTFATLHRVPGSSAGGEERVIGRGVGLVTWVAEAADHDVLTPVGGVGELLLEGPLVTAGYLDEPGKTAEVFVEDPAWLLRGGPGPDQPGRHGRLYKTGDLVRYRQDGSLVFVGRKDNQVKVNGQRLELGEVEHAVQRCLPESKPVGVVVELVTPAKGVKPILVAFLSLGASFSIPTSSDPDDATATDALDAAVKPILAGLDDRLAERLPAYMTPSAFLPVLSFPLTASGKLDRRSLRARASALTLEQLTASAAPHSKQAARTDAERRMQALWSAVLNIGADGIGREDSFLRVGGDSISVMKLVEAARRRDLFLTVADVFKSPRLRDLAAIAGARGQVQVREVAPFSLLQGGITSEEARAQAAELCSVAAGRVEDVFPCTPLQQGLLALTAKRAGDYVGQEIFTLHETIDVARFKEAWDSMVAATPVLRTRIVDLPGQGIVQVVIQEQLGWPEESEDSDTLPLSAKIDRLQPMGLGTPLTRFRLVREAGHHHLVWTIHHALYDGWSLLSMLNSLEKAYNDEPISPAVPFQGFVAHMIDTDPAQATAFWRREMDALEAPCFPPLPSLNHQPVAGRSVSRRIRGLHWPQEVDVTPSIAIRAAWSVVAAQYTGADDVVFGATVAGRSAAIPGVEAMVGPAIATVPLRVRLHDRRSVTVAQFLGGMQEQAVRMIEFEQTGLSQISRVSAEAKAACQFQTLLVVQPVEETQIGSDLFLPDSDDDEAQGFIGSFDTYAVNVICDLEQDGLHLQITYDEEVIAAETMTRMTAQLENVLRQLCHADNLHAKLADVVSINSLDLDDIWKWNGVVPETLDRCVHDLIKETVDKQPQAIAIDAWDGSLTYQELDQQSTRLAHRLVELGLQVGSIVPICFEKSMWTSVAMLAVMKAGGASAALDPAQSEDRLVTIVRQLQPQMILASPGCQKLAVRLAKTPGTAVVAVGEVQLNQVAVNDNTTLPIVAPEGPLFVLFTSGTTGTPKGVIVTHSNFSSTILHQHHYFGYNPSARVYDFSSYAFDAAWLNLLLSLSPPGRPLPRLRVTHVDMTPTAAGLLPERALRRLRAMTLGGEQLRPADARRWARLVGSLRNMYGPSECTATATILSVDPEAMVKDSIGRGVGLCTWIVDPETATALVPVGCVGELLLEGPLVGPGYLNEPEKTAAAFIEDPAWLLRGGPNHGGRRGRLYRTGDLVRYHHDGSIVYVGRKDTQVKVNGQRLELGGVEHVIQEYLSSTGSQTSVVVELVKPSQAQRPVLVAFLDTSQTSNLQDLQQQLQGGLEEVLTQHLPTNVTVTAFLPAAGLPQTATGKLDRKALRVRAEAATLQELAAANLHQVKKRAPGTPAEILLRELWATVLGVDAEGIGADDSFMRVGGDSIGAMRLVGAARRRGQLLTVADVLLHPKLCDAAQRLQRINDEPAQAVEAAGPSPLPTAVSSGISEERLGAVLQRLGRSHDEQPQDVLPVTDEQARSLAMTYSTSRSMLFYHALDRPAASSGADLLHIVRACSVLVSRFDILRTAFVVDGDSFLQVVLRSAKPEVATILDDDLEVCTAALLRRESSKPLDLGAPLTKFFVIYSETHQTYRVVMRLSHAQFDAISLGQMWSAFEDACKDSVVTLGADPVASFAAHMRSLSGLDRPEAVAYWRELLRGSSVTRLNERAPHALSRRGADVSITKSIPQSQLRSIDHTLPTVLGAAWAYVLAKRSEMTDIVLGVLTHGRDHPASEAVIGPCVNVVPLRVTLQDGWRVADLLAAAHAQRVAGIPHAQLGSRAIVRDCTSWPRDAYFGTVIRHNSYSDDETQASRMRIFESPGSGAVDVDSVEVHIIAASSDDTVDVEVSFAAGVVPANVARQLAADLHETVLRFCSGTEASLGGLPELPPMRCALPVRAQPVHVNGFEAKTLLAERCPPAKIEALRMAWRSVLGGDVELDAESPRTFFDLGGDLIGAGVLASHVASQGYLMTTEDVFEHPTWLSQLALLGGRAH